MLFDVLNNRKRGKNQINAKNNVSLVRKRSTTNQRRAFFLRHSWWCPLVGLRGPPWHKQAVLPRSLPETAGSPYTTLREYSLHTNTFTVSKENWHKSLSMSVQVQPPQRNTIWSLLWLFCWRELYRMPWDCKRGHIIVASPHIRTACHKKQSDCYFPTK